MFRLFAGWNIDSSTPRDARVKIVEHLCPEGGNTETFQSFMRGDEIQDGTDMYGIVSYTECVPCGTNRGGPSNVDRRSQIA